MRVGDRRGRPGASIPRILTIQHLEIIDPFVSFLHHSLTMLTVSQITLDQASGKFLLASPSPISPAPPPTHHRTPPTPPHTTAHHRTTPCNRP